MPSGGESGCRRLRPNPLNSSGQQLISSCLEALERGARWLSANQRKDGSFSSTIHRSARLEDPGQEEFAVFPTLLILRSLRRLPGFQVLRERAGAFVLGAKRPGGTWSYWYRDPPFHVPPDVDDTALALTVTRDLLTPAQRAEIVVRLAQNRDDCGLFWTWFDVPEHNDTDLVVNVNVIGALGEGSFTDAAIRLIQARLGCDPDGCTYYYPTKSALAYALAWAVDEGVTALVDPGERLQSGLVSSWKCLSDEDLAQSLAAGAHLGLGAHGEWRQGLARLLRLQGEDGGWPAVVIALGPRPPEEPEHWYASDSVHTALALEAIHGCLPLLEGPKSLT